MNKEQPLSYQQLSRAVELIQDFMEMEGLEFWVTQTRGDEVVAKKWVSNNILQRQFLEEQYG